MRMCSSNFAPTALALLLSILALHSSTVLGATPMPYGPYSFTSSLGSSRSAFARWSSPAPLPVLSPSGGLELTITSESLSECALELCASSLARAAEDTTQWNLGSSAASNTASGGVSASCALYANLTASATSSPVVLKAPALAPGQIAHLSLWSALRPGVESSSTNCSVSMGIGGLACPDGWFGAGCDVQPASVSRGSAPVSAELSPTGTAVVYFEVGPSSVYVNSLDVNVTTDPPVAGLNIALHESDLPVVYPAAPLNPLRDLNATTSEAGWTSLHVSLPSYVASSPARSRRFFLAVSSPTPLSSGTNVSVSVPSELSCPPGFHGAQCEFFAEVLLEPFSLASISGGDVVHAASFRWNAARTEIWYYFALIFFDAAADLEGFSVGVAGDDAPNLPELYIRRGAIPTLTHFDARHTGVRSAQRSRVLRTGPTAATSGVWFVGLHVPATYARLQDVGVFVNAECAGASVVVKRDGSAQRGVCNGRGVCDTQANECRCQGHAAGFSCLLDRANSGLSSKHRAAIILACLFGTLLAGLALCWWMRAGGGMDQWSARRAARRGGGHRLDDGAPHNPGPGGRPPPSSAQRREFGPAGFGRI